jgi:hypothetical protein
MRTRANIVFVTLLASMLPLVIGNWSLLTRQSTSMQMLA